MARLPAAVLWDMDGTLVDTEPYWIAAETDLVNEFGGVWTHELALSCVGNPLLVSAEILREQGGVDLPLQDIVDRLLARVVLDMRAHVPWRPGARELLDSVVAEGIPNALVTMSWTAFAQVLLDTLPTGTFAAVVTGDQVTHGKPHPEPYLTAAAALGVEPSECVAIEDSVPGVRSAVAANVPTLAVPHIVHVPRIAGAVQRESLLGVQAADLVSITTVEAAAQA